MAEDATTWTELKADLATLIVRDDLDDVIPIAIAQVERDFQRRVFGPERLASTTLTFSAQSANLPADFWGVETVWIDGSNKTPLAQVTIEDLRRSHPSTATGTPVMFAIEGETIWLGPIPATGTDVEVTYWQTIPALGSGQATNWLLTDHPDLYIAATLSWLHGYVQDDNNENRWRTKAEVILESVNRSTKRRTINSGPIAARPSITDRILSYVR